MSDRKGLIQKENLGGVVGVEMLKQDMICEKRIVLLKNIKGLKFIKFYSLYIICLGIVILICGI